MKNKNWKPGQRVTLKVNKLLVPNPANHKFFPALNSMVPKDKSLVQTICEREDKEMLKNLKAAGFVPGKVSKRKSTAPLPMPGVLRKKPTAPKELLDKLKQNVPVTGPAVRLENVECDNQNCQHNSMHGGKPHYAGKALCKLERITLTKTWAGSEKNYRLLCTSASDYPIKVRTAEMSHDRELGVDEVAARKFKGTT